MSTRNKNGMHYENHQRAAELQDIAAHAHGAAGSHGQQDHLDGPEQSRQSLEHTEGDHERMQVPTVGHGIIAFGHKDIESLAYRLWQERGSPDGSPEQDWIQAVEKLRGRTGSV